MEVVRPPGIVVARTQALVGVCWLCEVLLQFEVALDFVPHITLSGEGIEIGREVLEPVITLVAKVILNGDAILDIRGEPRRLVVYQNDLTYRPVAQELSEVLNHAVRSQRVFLALVPRENEVEKLLIPLQDSLDRVCVLLSTCSEQDKLEVGLQLSEHLLKEGAEGEEKPLLLPAVHVYPDFLVINAARKLVRPSFCVE